MRTTFSSFFKCLNVLHDQCGYYFNYIFIRAIVNITVTTFSIYIHMANGNAGIHVCATHAHVIKIMTI